MVMIISHYILVYELSNLSEICLFLVSFISSRSVGNAVRPHPEMLRVYFSFVLVLRGYNISIWGHLVPEIKMGLVICKVSSTLCNISLVLFISWNLLRQFKLWIYQIPKGSVLWYMPSVLLDLQTSQIW